ncbi:MAG: hypothetical protein G01um10143_424 [Parcubacteria group bacterium Gr01-1014_3]|nr:MAG: hypothetical protein G01um10143_424 [Parcubacteria group bacterium Gr01-1014_3]
MHKHKLILGLGLILIVGAVLVWSGVLGKQSGQPKTAQVQTVKVTKTYLDFQASPNYPSSFGDGQIHFMKVLDLPANAEIMAVEVFIAESIAPTTNFEIFSGTDIAPDQCDGAGTAGSSAIAGNESSNRGLRPQMIQAMCFQNTSFGIFLRDSNDLVDALTGGAMDFYVSYIVH